MKSNVACPYRFNETNRILQGDIFVNVQLPIVQDKILDFIVSPYLVVLSQDCDLNQDFNAHVEIGEINFDESNKEMSSFYNKMMPSILLSPAYPADKLREGIHLEFIGMDMV